jgi:hypothetical protein
MLQADVTEVPAPRASDVDVAAPLVTSEGRWAATWLRGYKDDQVTNSKLSGIDIRL